MTLKPVPLHKHPRVVAAKRECLDVLKDVERRVRAGEIESLGIIMVTRDGRSLIERTDVARLDPMVSGTVRLQRDVLDLFKETDAAD